MRCRPNCVEEAADDRQYAVIGNPIAHSKSPEIHARFAQQTGEDIRYERLLAPLDGFAQTVPQPCRPAGRAPTLPCRSSWKRMRWPPS
jgi:shikimate 5-dehydrogenase